MDRSEFFQAIRPAFPDSHIPAGAIPVLDAVADRLGMARVAEPPSPPPKPSVPIGKKPGPLALVIGAAAAAALSPFVVGWESGSKQYLVPYRDIVGVWTQCHGETKGVTALSPRETPEGCDLKLDKRLAGFAQEVVACTPNLRGRDMQWAAATSLAYNIGTGAYCRSTVDRRFDAGQWQAACDAMLMWDKAGGKRVQGLANRRAAERELCLKGV